MLSLRHEFTSFRGQTAGLLPKGKEKEFYIRSDNTSRPLDIEEAYKYIMNHWK